MNLKKIVSAFGFLVILAFLVPLFLFSYGQNVGNFLSNYPVVTKLLAVIVSIAFIAVIIIILYKIIKAIMQLFRGSLLVTYMEKEIVEQEKWYDPRNILFGIGILAVINLIIYYVWFY